MGDGPDCGCLLIDVGRKKYSPVDSESALGTVIVLYKCSSVQKS